MNPELNPTRFTLKRLIFLLLKIILLLIVFYFIYLQVKTNWDDIKTYDWAVSNFWLLIGSIICAIFSFFVFSSCWNMVVRGFGENLGLMDSFKISYLSNLGRYIPGKIWQLFGIIYIARQYGLSPEKATASFAISQLFMTVTAFLILAISAQLEPTIITDQIAFMGKGSAILFTFGMIAVSLIVVIWPDKILAFGNMILKRFSRPVLTFSIDKKVAPVIFVGYCVAWISYGAAFWMFIRSVVEETDMALIPAIGIFAGSYQIGYLVLFAPGGFGPREFIMSQMLMPYLPGVAPVVAILSRLWTTAIEVVATGISLLVKKPN